MKVTIKKFDVAMEIKKNGIELDICDPSGANHLGDLYVTMSGLIWCRGKKQRRNGCRVNWEQFIQMMESK